MATTPTITDAGALAVTPVRVNIFAKPSAPQDQTDPAARQPRSVFDDAAACHSTDEVTDRPAASSAHGSGGLGGAGALRRSAYLVPWQRPLRASSSPSRCSRGATARPRHRRHRPFASSDNRRFPRAEPAILPAARRQATQAAQTRRIEPRARPARPAALGGRGRQPRAECTAPGSRRPGSARRGARPTAPDPRGARRPARVHVNGGSHGP